MKKSIAVGTFFASTVGVACVYASAFLPGGAPPAAVPLLIVSIATMMVSTMIIGVSRGGSIGRLALPFAFAWLVMVVGFLAVFLMPAETAAAPALFLGLPRRAAIVLYGVGLLPLFAMPFAYALTFEDATLSEADLDRLRSEATAILARERNEGAL
jgi:hypothetical protein